MLQLEAEKQQLIADNENLTQVLTDTSERLTYAIRTKAQINDKRTATIMGKLSGDSNLMIAQKSSATAFILIIII